MRLRAGEQLVGMLDRSDASNNPISALWVVRQRLSHDYFDNGEQVPASMVQFSRESTTTTVIVEPIAIGTPVSKPMAKMAGRYAAKRKSEPAQTPIAQNVMAAATLAAAMVTPMYAGIASPKATRSRMLGRGVE